MNPLLPPGLWLHRRASAGLLLVALAGLLVGLLASCGPPPPPLSMLLVVRESAAALDTSEVKSLLVRVGQVEQAVLALRDDTEDFTLEAEPTGEVTEIVVFACDGEATCEDRFARFVGCAVETLEPSETVKVVQIFLFDIATPEAACVPFLSGE